jgi:hypothetical protein
MNRDGQLERLYLEGIRLASKSFIEPNVLRSARFDMAWLERCAWQDAYEFRRMFTVAGEQKTETLCYPADWWQAFKERWFPAWALKRWPAKQRFFEFHAVRVFTEVPPPIGDTIVYQLKKREFIR